MSPVTGLQTFVASHYGPLLITTALMLYATARHKLTPGGVLAAVVTAVIHMCFPSPVCFALPIIFFLTGTIATRVNHAKKGALTQSATGGGGGEGPRNASQVVANSAAGTILVLWYLYCINSGTHVDAQRILLGIAASYAAAAADTLSSELGILSPTSPFLVTRPWQSVPKGTNGGVTYTGLAAGLLGSTVIAAVYLLQQHAALSSALGVAVFGLFGSILDSVLGAVCQVTVEDKASGRVVEGANGRRVLVKPGGSRVQRGTDLLNNNGVNFAMTAIIAVLGMYLIPL